MNRFEYATESPLWYFLAHRAVAAAEQRLPSVFSDLNHRAVELDLPIAYQAPHALAWAVICQLYIVTQPRADSFGPIGFRIMRAAFSRVLSPKGFVDLALGRIIGNIKDPSSPGRSPDESMVDTFLANGLKLIDQEQVDPSLDHNILTTCLTDSTMFSLGATACSPPEDLWNGTVIEYDRRRPGAFRRNFSDPNRWLFG